MAGPDLNVDAALAAAKGFPGLSGMDLAKEVTCAAPYEWTKGSWSLTPKESEPTNTSAAQHIVAMDFRGKAQHSSFVLSTVDARLQLSRPLIQPNKSWN